MNTIDTDFDTLHHDPRTGGLPFFDANVQSQITWWRLQLLIDLKKELRRDVNLIRELYSQRNSPTGLEIIISNTPVLQDILKKYADVLHAFTKTQLRRFQAAENSGFQKEIAALELAISRGFNAYAFNWIQSEILHEDGTVYIMYCSLRDRGHALREKNKVLQKKTGIIQKILRIL